MTLVFKLVTICSIAVLASAQLIYDDDKFIPTYEQTQSTYTVQQLPKEDTPIFDISLAEFQPPKPDTPRPFFIEEPSEDLKPPTKEAIVFSYDPESYPPAPAEELQLPSAEKWNPNNDPNLYYPTEIPTQLYPKKYNKDVGKAAKTKVMLTDAELAEKKKFVDKVLLSLAKQENKKRLEKERLEQEQEQLEETRDSYQQA